jgi:hypothetical protein
MYRAKTRQFNHLCQIDNFTGLPCQNVDFPIHYPTLHKLIGRPRNGHEIPDDIGVVMRTSTGYLLE